MAQQEAVIVLQDVLIQLGRRTILDKVNMTIEQGEFVTILGPNGAGKSTLLKVLLGLLKPKAGIVQVFGKPPRLGNSEIGYVPQHRQLETAVPLRARDVVGFGLDGNRWGIGLPNPKRREIVDEVLREVDAVAFADAPISMLSGGEQQRLLVAQALLTNPRLLLMDEPTASLDLSHEQEIVQLVTRVCRQRKIAVMLVTHDINPFLPVVDRVLYLVNGRSTIGTPAEVITSDTLSRLYGSPVQVVETMNRLFVVGAQGVLQQ